MDILADDGLRSRLGKAGRSWVKREYSLCDKIKQYERLFRTLGAA